MRTKTTETTVGRGGLVIPAFELNRVCPKYDVINFFNKLWVANGFEIEDYGYAHELVVPPAEDKPLIVIRSSAQRTSQHERALEQAQARNSGIGDWSNSNVTLSREQHSILMPPDKAGAFVAHLAIRYARQSENIMDDPWLIVKGKSIHDDNFSACDVAESQMSAQELIEDRRQRFQAGIQAIMAETVELLA